jgi:hypothetical protein
MNDAAPLPVRAVAEPRCGVARGSDTLSTLIRATPRDSSVLA